MDVAGISGIFIELEVSMNFPPTVAPPQQERKSLATMIRFNRTLRIEGAG